MLHVIDGYMADLEFYGTSDEHPFGRPTLDSLRLAEWSDPNERSRTLVSPDQVNPTNSDSHAEHQLFGDWDLWLGGLRDSRDRRS